MTSTETLLDSLPALGAKHREDYAGARPFPHFAFDGLLPEELLDRVLGEITASNKEDWRALEQEGSSKYKSITPGYEVIGPAGRELFAFFRTPQFLRFVEELSGLKGLLADAEMLGGGWHSIRPGGYLELHADFSWNPRIRLYRRINVLLYLNKDWKDEYNGKLELWDKDLTEQVEYTPSWNRLVICDVTADTLHGFPKEIACPDGQARNSVALWLYTADIPESMQLSYDQRETDFLKRKGGKARPLPTPLIRQVLPPVVYNIFHNKFRHSRVYYPAEVLTRFKHWFIPPAIRKLFSKTSG